MMTLRVSPPEPCAMCCNWPSEYASDGITVNAYCPGTVGTDMWMEIDKRFAEITGAPIGATYKKYVEGIALGGAETPEDVAETGVSVRSGAPIRWHRR